MKIRAHRGGVKESLATITEIEPTLEAVTKHVGATDPTTVTVEPYFLHQDVRTGWKAHYLVKIDGALWGFTDGPLDLNVTPTKCPRCKKPHAWATLCHDCLTELVDPKVWELIDAAKAYRDGGALVREGRLESLGEAADKLTGD